MDSALSHLIQARLEFFRRWRSEPVQRSFLIGEQRILDILSHSSAHTVLRSIEALNRSIPSNWNEPVTVAPTTAQRDAAFEEPTDTTESACSICQESLQNGEGRVRLRECQHTFHRRCATEWYSRSVYCPLCRSDIRTSNTIR